MNVIYDIITEEMFAYFDADTYGSLLPLVDDVIALQIQKYLTTENNGANPEIRTEIAKYLGPLSSSYAFNKELESQGILTLLAEISPDTILSNNAEYIADVRKKLTFLQENYSKVRSTIPGRSVGDFNNFYNMLVDCKGITESQLKYVRQNRDLFYRPHEKDRRLASAYCTTSLSRWTMCLNAILYDDYCKSHGILQESVRSAFM